MTAGTGTGLSRRTALATLVDATRQLEGLTGQIGCVALTPDVCASAPELVGELCRVLDVPLRFDAPDEARHRDYVVAALGARIRVAQNAPCLAGLTAAEVAEFAGAAHRLRVEEDSRYRQHILHRPDGTLLRVVEAGPRRGRTIVMSPACAMDARLCEPWLAALSGTYRCLVLQTRGTYGRIGDAEDFDRLGYDIDEQADDLAAVLDHFGTEKTHLMAFCGGVVPALAVAASRPDRVSSLSVWHGDLELGEDAVKTQHQKNLRALLDLAGESRDTSGWVRERLTSGPMAGVPDGIGPLVVRPYATTELFYRYAKLTGATMHWDCRATAAEVTQPCLVVTSQDDHTAHPAGSQRLAEILLDATLVVAEHGTHLDAFGAGPEQREHLTDFLVAHDPDVRLTALGDIRAPASGP